MPCGSTQPAASGGRMSPWTDAPQQKPVLIMNIDIGDGHGTGRLEINKGDNCDELAVQFCKRHNLPVHIVSKQLSQQIARSMAQKGLLSAGQQQREVAPALSEDDESSDEEETSSQTASPARPVRCALDESSFNHTFGTGVIRTGQASSSTATVVNGQGSSPGVRGGPNLAKNLQPMQSARVEVNNVWGEESQRCWGTGWTLAAQEQKKKQDSHERLYKRGMRMLEDRKKRIEENSPSTRSSSVGKQRPSTMFYGQLPGYHMNMRARCRSAPRHRGSQEESNKTHKGEEVTPQHKKTKDKPFRPGGTPNSLEKAQARTSPSEIRSKSAPPERPTLVRASSAPEKGSCSKDDSGTQVPAYERLFNLACRFSPANELRQEFVSRTGFEQILRNGLVCDSKGRSPWTAGTHWHRAERDRMERTTSEFSRSERSHTNRSETSADFEQSIHERLYQESRAKMTELQEKAEERRKQQEEQDRNATRRGRFLSERTEEILTAKGCDDSSVEIFDKLYEEGIKRSAEKQRLHEENLKAREVQALLERESKFLPGRKVKAFHPDVSKSTRSIRRDEPWDDHYYYGVIEKKKQQEEENKLESELKELSKCTFCPQISKFASQHQRDLMGTGSLHQYLFEEAKERELKRLSPRPAAISAKKVTKKEEEV